MYANCAYLEEPHKMIVNTDTPLLVTAVGNYRIHTRKILENIRPNGRADYQLIYIASGKMHLVLHGKKQTVPKGNMILFRPGEPQNYSIHAEDRSETFWVHFTGNQVESILADYDIPQGKNIFFTGISHNYKWLFLQMIQELQLKRTHFKDTMPLHLKLLLLYISRTDENGQLITAELLDEVENAMHYFNNNFHSQIVIEDYAKQHNMTPCWFIQNFKKITGTTPMQYIVSLRINNATNLLDDTEYSIEKIANSVGYDNALYFSRLFRKHVGMSPREYRKRNKNLDA